MPMIFIQVTTNGERKYINVQYIVSFAPSTLGADKTYIQMAHGAGIIADMSFETFSNGLYDTMQRAQ